MPMSQMALCVLLATKEKRRYTLNTPSWAEALREASAFYQLIAHEYGLVGA
jgi:hypothetical protein